jgi:hypothetical protein
MKMKKIIIAWILAVTFVATPVFAATFTIEDNWRDWPGYTSQIPGKDEQGTPMIDYMNVTLDDSGILEQVDVVLKAENTTWQEFNSLFINSYGIETWTAKWDDWDYFVHDGGNSNKTGVSGTVPIDGIYSVNTGGYDYTITRNDNSVRKYTPNGIDADDLTDFSDGSGWTTNDFTYSHKIQLDSIISISYKPSECHT